MDALRSVGCFVILTHTVGRGCPDAFCYSPFMRRWLPLEIKDGSKKPSARKLTPDEERLHAECPGPIYVINSVSEALMACGATVL